MSRQPNVKLDAVAAGVRALLEVWPNSPIWSPTLHWYQMPKGSHEVFWRDDWFRGVDLASDCIRRAFGGDMALALRLSSDSEREARSTDDREALRVLRQLLTDLMDSGDPDFPGPPKDQYADMTFKQRAAALVRLRDVTASPRGQVSARNHAPDWYDDELVAESEEPA